MLLITCLTQDMSLSNWWRAIGNYELWGKLFGWHSGSALGAIIGIVKISVQGGSWFLSLVGDKVVWKVQSELWIPSQVSSTTRLRVRVILSVVQLRDVLSVYLSTHLAPPPTLLLSDQRLLVSCPASCRLWWRWQQLILIRFDPRTHFYIWGVFIMTGIPGRWTLSSHRGHVITWKLALKTEQTCLWRTLNYSLNNYRALPDLTPWWEDEK